jgi:hypothetical protein
MLRLPYCASSITQKYWCFVMILMPIMVVITTLFKVVIFHPSYQRNVAAGHGFFFQLLVRVRLNPRLFSTINNLESHHLSGHRLKILWFQV